MAQYIPKDALVSEIERLKGELKAPDSAAYAEAYIIGAEHTIKTISDVINTLEVKEMDFGKLGEIARHLIAVKEHIEDIRLDYEEWSMLEKIGYPERFKA